MIDWKPCRLSDIITIKHGWAFKGEFFSEEPTDDILLTPGNFLIGGGFKSSKFKYYNGEVPSSYILKSGDVIVTMTDLSKQADTLGFSAKVPNDKNKRYLHNQRIGLVGLKDNDFDLEFIYWLLRTESYQKFVAGSATGATVKHTSPTKIYFYKFIAPKLKSTQKRISSILSAYDDLIENNLKRIKLLEEIAQRTYEEWFVKFRVNGEELPIDEVTGLPFGWSNKKLVEVAILTMGQSPKSEFYNTTRVGLPFHQGVSDYGFRFPENSTWSTQGNRNAEKGDILFSVRAPVGRLNIAIEKIILGRGLASVRHKKGLNNKLYYQLQNIFFKDDLIGGGAIFSSVTKKDVERIEVVIANEQTELLFNSVVSDIDKQIEMLTLQIRLLKQSRDILLPRLMSGTINVES
jgi:type I restriction enzyme S subunit